MQLRYRLDSDKQKTPSTSIRSPEELKLFMNRMRPLIVARKLSSGKKSTQMPKAFTVYFEDGAGELAAGTAAGSSKTSTKPVGCFLKTPNQRFTHCSVEQIIRCSFHYRQQ
jgi:hypothetical protein